MKLSRLIENLYQQVFIGIVVQQKSVQVNVQLFKGSKFLKEYSKIFVIEDSTPTIELNEYLKNYMDESPYFYISVLNDCSTQGALPTCSMHEAENFDDLGSSVTLCNDNRWMVYSDKTELNRLQKRFSFTGIDFIFSPFLLLSNFFKDKIDGVTSILVLIQEDYLSISIFAQGKLLYAKYICVVHKIEDDSLSGDLEESTDESLSFALDNDDSLSINLDDLDSLDEFESLDELDNLQDLDSLDDLDDIEDFEESLDEAVEESEVALEEAKAEHGTRSDNFGKEYKHFQLIQVALNEFYNDTKYNNQFVEEAYIADSTDSGHELIKFLEEELFLTAFKRNINLEKELVKMSIQEANL